MELNIIDDFDARHVYDCLRAYSRGSRNRKEVSFENLWADKIGYETEGETLKFLDLNTEVKLTFHTHPVPEEQPESNKGVLNYLRKIKVRWNKFMHPPPRPFHYIHTLELVISGKDKATEETIEKIKTITGRTDIEKYIKNEEP